MIEHSALLPVPHSSRVVTLFRRAFQWTTALCSRDAALTAAAGFLCVAAFDRFSGPGVSAAIGYLTLICFTAWTLREKAGFFMLGLSILVMHLINGIGSNDPVENLDLGMAVALWNGASRALTGGLMVLLVSTLRHALDVERWRASTDALTGALNKRAFCDAIEHDAQLAAHRNDKLLLAYMDLDGFKQVNDRHGHAAGDAVLRCFAAEASRRVRTGDLFARIGGDEFAALLFVPQGSVADAVAGTLHARLSDALRGTGYAVTCSMGAVIVEPGQTAAAEALVDLADALMYEVKNAGKNSLRIAYAPAASADGTSLQAA